MRRRARRSSPDFFTWFAKHRVPVLTTVACMLAGIVGILIYMNSSPNSSQLIAQGEAYLKKGQLSSSIISLKNAVQTDPASAKARFLLAEALERNGSLVDAEQQYRQAQTLGIDADQTIPRIVVLMLDSNDTTKLIREFGKTTLKSKESDSDLRAAVALAYLEARNIGAAKAQLAAASQSTAATHVAAAQIALSEMRKQDALTELATLKNDTHVPWWALRARSRVYAATGDDEQALDSMRLAHETAPWHQGLMGEYAEKLIAAGRFDQARPLRDKLKKIAPAYYRTFFLDSIFLAKDGKFDDAYTAAMNVLKILPDHIAALAVATRLELRSGEFASAESHLTRLQALAPDLVEGYALLAELDLRQGKIAAASDAITKGLGKAPKDRALLGMSGEVAWQKGDRDRAIKNVEDAASVQPPQPQVLLRLAQMRSATGQRDKAIEALEQAQKLSATESGIREEIFLASLKMNLQEQARNIADAEVSAHPSEPQGYLWQGAVKGSSGDAAAALALTRKALTIKPDYYPALLILDKLLRNPQERAELLASYKKGVDSGGTEARVYLGYSQLLQGEKARPEQRMEAIKKGLHAVPTSVALRREAVSLWLAADKKDKALVEAQEGATANPGNAELAALVASTLEMTGDLQQATTKYQQLAEQNPQTTDWHVKVARLQRQAGQKKDAIATLRTAIKARPSAPHPYQMLAMLQAEIGDFDEALLTVRLLKEQKGQTASALLLEGDVQVEARKYPQALRLYDEAAKAGAAQAAFMHRIAALDRSDDKEAANAELARWLIKYPNDVDALALGAQRASARGNYAEAAKFLEIIVKSDPQNAIAMNDLAWAYVQAGNPQALEVAQRAAAAAPSNSSVLDTLAMAQAASGKADEAISTLRQALRNSNGTEVVKVHLADLLMKKGSQTEAREMLSSVDPKNLDREARQQFDRLKSQL
jgi:cellulose synthase operon protein C